MGGGCRGVEETRRAWTKAVGEGTRRAWANAVGEETSPPSLLRLSRKRRDDGEIAPKAVAFPRAPGRESTSVPIAGADPPTESRIVRLPAPRRCEKQDSLREASARGVREGECRLHALTVSTEFGAHAAAWPEKRRCVGSVDFLYLSNLPIVLPEELARGLPRAGGALGAGHRACPMMGPTAVVATRGRRAAREVGAPGGGGTSPGIHAFPGV